jgi:hypothetical protein
LASAEIRVGLHNGTDRTDKTSGNGVLSVLSVPGGTAHENFRVKKMAVAAALTRVASSEPAPFSKMATPSVIQSVKFASNVPNGPDKTDGTTGYGILSDVPAPYAQRFADLQRACPDGVPEDRWRLCLEDALRFFDRWGRQAQKLGWSGQDLLGLHPTAPMARHDQMGLLWSLRGQTVTELGAKHAKLSGGLTFRKRA